MLSVMTLQIEPATAERFDDVAAVLAPRGQAQACWCLSARLSSAENNRVTDRPGRLRELLARDPAPGLLAYRDDAVAGWCAVGPRASMGRLVRSRTIATADDQPVWSVVCFVVRVGFRRQGVAAALLEGAVRYAADHGAPAIEGYPVDPGGARIDTASAYVGTVPMFEAAGFRRMLQTQARSAGRPRWLMRRDLDRRG